MTCAIEGCDGAVRARGWCNPHWTRWRKHGDPAYVRVRQRDLLCVVEGCSRRRFGRGWCGAHYGRWSKYGDPLGVATRVDPVVRFSRFVGAPDADGCTPWLGAISDVGYGNFWLDGTTVLAHRQAWLYAGLTIPAGLQLDHLCRNRRCVNVLHLEPVTQAENVRRQPSNAGWFASQGAES